MALRKAKPAAVKSAKPSLKARLATKTSGKVASKTAVKKSAKSENGFNRARKEHAQKEKYREMLNNRPFRVKVPVGGSKKVIVLDSGQPYFHYEHNYQTKSGKWNGVVTCIKEDGDCPACKALGKEGYYAMLLTVIDVTGYTKSNGEKVKNQNMILMVKGSIIQKYERIFKKHNGNLRGVMLDLIRDGAKDYSSGNDVEVIKRIPENILKTKYKDVCTPCDYEKAFPRKELKEQFGNYSVPGDDDFEEDGASLDSVDFEDDDE